MNSPRVSKVIMQYIVYSIIHVAGPRLYHHKSYLLSIMNVVSSISNESCNSKLLSFGNELQYGVSLSITATTC